jgi:hypothetical protein
MIPIRLQSASASSMLWVVKTTARWLIVRRITFQRFLRLTGSGVAMRSTGGEEERVEGVET